MNPMNPYLPLCFSCKGKDLGEGPTQASTWGGAWKLSTSLPFPSTLAAWPSAEAAALPAWPSPMACNAPDRLSAMLSGLEAEVKGWLRARFATCMVMVMVMVLLLVVVVVVGGGDGVCVVFVVVGVGVGGVG